MSLSVKLFNESDDLFNDDFWISQNKQTVVVCPSPSDADRARSALAKDERFSSIDVITISKFISNQFVLLEEPPKISRKSDLLLSLSIFWKTIFPDYNYQRFIQSFTLLTELRGTSLELETVEEILDHYHPQVRDGVKVLWTSMINADLNDEHSSYSLLARAYRETPSPFEFAEEQKIIFHGFGHLSGIQVDLLKSIAIRQEVIIPYRRSLYQKRYQTDWISWISTDELVVEDEMEFSLVLKTIRFPKNRMAESLSKIKLQNVDVVLGTARPALRDFLEIPFDGMYFKTPIDLLGDLFTKFEAKIRTLFGENKEQIIQTKTVLESIAGFQQECLSKSDFRGIKALNLLKEIIGQWLELASSNESMSIFDWEVLRNCTHLNAPRIYQAPHLGLEARKGKILSFTDAVDIKNDEDVIVCVNSSHSSFKLAASEYSQDVAALLSSLGPRRRAELDFLKAREDFREALKRTRVKLFIEEGLVEHDLGWAEMFKGITFDSIIQEHGTSKVRKDLLSNLPKLKTPIKLPISPSRLQNYIDCPRKYYYQFIEKVNEKAIKQSVLEPRFLGEIEHSVVEKFLKNEVKWNSELHQKLCKIELESMLLKHQIQLERSDYLSALLEVKIYSKNGITFLMALKGLLPDAVFIFEEKYKDGDYAGRVDLIVQTPLGIGVLDFKRSGASIPNKNEHESFEKIQLWNYLRHIKQGKMEYLFWGYLCLRDLSESLIYSAWNELSSSSFENLQLDLKINQVEEEKMKQDLLEYSDIENNSFESLKNDNSWLAQPLTKKTCTFCDVSNLCTRGLY